MSDEMRFELFGVDELKRKIKELHLNITGILKTEINLISLQLVSWLRRTKFVPYSGGTSSDTLQNRSYRLRNSIKVLTAKKAPIKTGWFSTDDAVIGGVTIGEKYAAVHFGKKGATTKIKGNPWLTIPLPAAMNTRGVAKGRANDPIFGETFFLKSKTNPADLVLYGKTMQTQGKKSGEYTGKVKPLFVLKRSVEVKTRVHPEDLWEYAEPLIGKALTGVKKLVESSYSIKAGIDK